jgi:hypothetical protein
LFVTGMQVLHRHLNESDGFAHTRIRRLAKASVSAHVFRPRDLVDTISPFAT